MAGVHDLALFVLSGLLLNITPGPDTLYIVGRSAGEGARAGAVAALGIGTGCCIHMLAAAIGLSAVLLASATAFTVVKLLGAAYLVYIGVALLRSRVAAEAPRPAAAAPLPRVFLQGLLTNVLNPKVALFFVAFLPQFVVPDAPHQFAALLLLGLIFNVNGTIWNLLVAALAARGRIALGRRGGANWIARVTGSLLVVLGVRLAFISPP